MLHTFGLTGVNAVYLPQYSYRVATVRALRSIVAIAAGAWVGAVSGASAPGADTARAVIKSQEIKFSYQSFDVSYTCDGIQAKVQRVLLALGASKELEVEARGCSDSRELLDDLRRSPIAASLRSPLVTIRVTSAVEATPEALAELEKTRSQRQLAARVRGETLDAAAQFDAPWKPVSLSTGEQGLDAGDCQLVEALRKHVLPKLGVRTIKDNVKCPSRQLSRVPARMQLEVEALMLPPPPEAGSTTLPADPSAEGESAPKP
jgi:hypothetical protein